MKLRLFSILLLTTMGLLTLTGCNLFTIEERLDAAEDSIENRIDAVEDAVENRVEQAPIPKDTQPIPQQTSGNSAASSLTKEEANAIALEHAGFAADQVNYLHTEYEIDDGIPQYEIEFHHDRLEYDYVIHAETGAILSYDMDN